MVGKFGSRLGEKMQCLSTTLSLIVPCCSFSFRNCVPFEESYVIRESDVSTFVANHGFDDKETA